MNAILTKAYSTLGPAGESPAAQGRSAAQQTPRPADGQEDRFQPGRYWQNRAVGKDAAAVPGGSYVARAYRSQGSVAVAAAGSGGEQESPAVASGKDSEAEPGRQKKGAVADESKAAGTNPIRAKGSAGETLSQEEVARLLELKQADSSVRAHEQAHLAAAGGLAKGGASFAYQKGPDGRDYAVAGEVQIDTSKGATPEETIARMTRVKAAALAPANPSSQDMKVARAASMAMSEASRELHVARRGAPAQQDGAGAEESSSAPAEGETENKDSAVRREGGQSVVAARAASRYQQAQAKGFGAFHLAV